MGEEAETEVWLDMSKDFSYINNKEYEKLIHDYREIARMLNGILKNPEKFCH